MITSAGALQSEEATVPRYPRIPCSGDPPDVNRGVHQLLFRIPEEVKPTLSNDRHSTQVTGFLAFE